MGMLRMVDDIYDHFEEFQILLDASHGTRYTDFVERLVDIETEYTYKYMEAVQIQNETSQLVTEDFIHIMTHAMIESVFEIVRHKMGKEQAYKYVDMLEKYHYGGWNTIFQYDGQNKDLI